MDAQASTCTRSFAVCAAQDDTSTHALKTCTFCPFIGRDRSDARNAIVSATSAGVMSAAAPPLASAHIFVSTDPGLTQFTRTPEPRSSTASASVNEISAPLLAQYD